ncbi:MAG: hypothetical protein ABUK08_00315 [Candidatus Humimicrobiaceae bacterium]
MQIRVEVKNDILGNSVFWEGDSSNIANIANIIARLLAEHVVKDGITRSHGMWLVYEVNDDGEIF